MRSLIMTAILVVLAAACRKSGGAAKDSVDTSMVFIGEHAPPGDSEVAWSKARDSVLAAVGAYYSHRISADSAATVLMGYIKRSQRSVNVQLDDSLRAAVRRHR